MEKIQKNIGVNLREVRKNRQLSLDATASLTGVSKAMLGQIERGESNPTVTTLWKIATGLQISFSTLLRDEETEISCVRFDDILPIIEEDGKYRVHSIFPFDPRTKIEMFYVEIDPNCEHLSDEHSDGVEEFITVTEGELIFEVDQQSFLLKTGDSIRFTANKPHLYKNASTKLTKYHATIYYR